MLAVLVGIPWQNQQITLTLLNKCVEIIVNSKTNTLKGGVRKSNKAPYFVKGYRLFDKVLFDNRECFIFGRRATGYFDLRLLDGTKIHASATYKKLVLLEKAKPFLIERRDGVPPMTKVTGLCAASS